MANDTYRFRYSGSFGEEVFICFSTDTFYVKRGNTSSAIVDDTTRLGEIEKFHYGFLKRRFPLDTSNLSLRNKVYVDSLIKLYPELLDQKYYLRLAKRVYRTEPKSFVMTSYSKPWTKENFEFFISEINNSGFWQLPYIVPCSEPLADGFGYSLEVNTKNKYQVVAVSGCPSDSTKLKKVCQRLINFAGLANDIDLSIGVEER